MGFLGPVSDYGSTELVPTDSPRRGRLLSPFLSTGLGKHGWRNIWGFDRISLHKHRWFHPLILLLMIDAPL